MVCKWGGLWGGDQEGAAEETTGIWREARCSIRNEDELIPAGLLP